MNKVAANRSRRDFIQKSGLLIFSTAALQAKVPFALAASQNEGKKPEGEMKEEISPVEDLMREHGVLARILLIYEDISLRVRNNQNYPLPLLTDAVDLIRRFVEDYHERLEEEHVFPRFEKAGKLVDLVKILREQHRAGRRLTERIRHLGSQFALGSDEKKEFLKQLDLFSRMYRPHKSREDTVLFPAFRSIVSAKEYDSLGDKFEEKEDELFGEQGFEKVVDRVAGIEKTLGIYDIARFTPP